MRFEQKAGRRQPTNEAPRPTPLSWASGFDGHAQELRECSATLERAFAHVERADLGPGLLDDFAFLIDLLVAQSALGLLLQFEPNFDYRHVRILLITCDARSDTWRLHPGVYTRLCRLPANMITRAP